MNTHADFLVEIHTEELPPKSLTKLAKAFLAEIEKQLQQAKLNFTAATYFATPRRLAVLINDLTMQQPDSTVERKGPALDAAFDKEGNPTPACMGFARSCGVTPKELITLANNTGSWVGFQQVVMGKLAAEILPKIVQSAIAALPIQKPMRWGNNGIEFVRPVHSVILLLGKNIIEAEILGCKTSRKTRGHRFHSSGWLEIDSPDKYVDTLKKGFVIANFAERKKLISEMAYAQTSQVHITETLLDEVTGLVEWPTAITGKFDNEFLNVPQEALISAMQYHQRYFPVVAENGKLLAQFVAITNLESNDVAKVIAGNERVLRARLADAAFFFVTDKKQSLESRLSLLKNSIFQAKLGTLYEKSIRLSTLADFIAKELNLDQTSAKRAALLAKTDLTSELVGEFPELQGIAGYYYALNDGESESVAKAITEHYMPRFSGDELPTTPLGNIVALADRLDTLVGVFGINQQPTGDKDPFGLRRAALGVLRILIEKKMNLDLSVLLAFTAKNYSTPLENKEVITHVLNFMLERLKPLYQEQGITADVLAAVTALNITKPYDLHCRIQAVQLFKKMSQSESLSVANKRVSNILAKYTHEIALREIDEALFETDAERELATQLRAQQSAVTALSQAAKYQEVLTELAHLREPVDNFFDKVLVMTEDKSRRENRLLMLKQLRELFLQVADIALLQ